MKKQKVIALHLPQYYETKENNEWWGKGFTDWVNVKKAEPLFDWHHQPIQPLNGNYYDMSSLKTISWQADLAKKYGIYGFCFYHYWFNGKLILEKPCEILLDNREVDLKYCFCWANESWIRTWGKGGNQTLVKQEYGDTDDWIKHIEYLSRFFKDERYIRHKGHPMLFIYSINDIVHWNEMLNIWNDYLRDRGIPEIFVVEFITAHNTGIAKQTSDAICEFQPHCVARYGLSFFQIAMRILRKKLGVPDVLDYNYLWRQLLKNKRDYHGKPIVKCAFVAFDNTARKLNRAMITKGANPEAFREYIKKLADDERRNYLDDYIIINAWNEWAEGAVLEPTDEFKYGYLEAIRELNL